MFYEEMSTNQFCPTSTLLVSFVLDHLNHNKIVTYNNSGLICDCDSKYSEYDVKYRCKTINSNKVGYVFGVFGLVAILAHHIMLIDIIN